MKLSLFGGNNIKQKSKYNYTSLKRYCPRVFSPAQKSLSESWAEFIEKFEPFSWYLTLTFREKIHPEQANRRYMRFVRRLNEAIYGKRYREKGKGVTHSLIITIHPISKI